MSNPTESLPNEFHWLMDILHNLDVGLVVLDMEMNIKLWNGFMQNHSAKTAQQTLDKNVFEVFPELPEAWFRRKLQTVSILKNAAFTTWEQRPYLFRFKNYRPITSSAEYMYQNCTIQPMVNHRGQVDHLCLIIYDVTEVAVNRLQLQAANQKLHAISRTDGLTGLLNRKTWEQALDHEFKRYQRHQHVCSLIMFDIDHFKPINDNYGHTVGDEVIRHTARTITQSIRSLDQAGRYGGEEFVVTLADTNAAGAHIVAERLRREVEASEVHWEQAVVRYTISLGIAELTPDITSRTIWIERADQALYQAKNAGRNRVVVAAPLPTPK